MAVNVNRWNFHHLLPKILDSITNATFVSVDFEFLGLPSVSGKDGMSLFDTPSDRYGKLCDAIRRFPPCQLGLACFAECGGEFRSRRYRVDVFCITVFKRTSKQEFSISPPALQFLTRHGFDFKQFIVEGVTYCNQTELAKLRDVILSGDYDFDLFEYGLSERMRALRGQIVCEMIDERDTLPFEYSSDTNCQKRPIIIELFRNGDKGYAFEKCLWDRPLNSIEEVVMTFALSEEFPGLEFHIDEERTLLYVGRRPLMFGHPEDEERLHRREESLRKLFDEVSGLSQIFFHICSRKLPIVGHNCLLDLLYIYNCFEADLPATYTEWKKNFHDMFPVILDTKVLAGALKNVLFPGGITDISLPVLGNLLTFQPCSTSLLPHTALIINGEEQSETVFKEQWNYHNAAFDALVTGDVLVKMAHLFVSTKCSLTSYKPLPLRNLFIALQKEVANKIPIPLIDIEYCNMAGADPSGDRPDIIEVRHRRHLLWVPNLTVKANMRKLFSKLHRYFFGSMEISDEQFEYIRRCLIHIFGDVRVDVRLGARRRSLEIATNSAITYARVCEFFQTRDDYVLMSSSSQTYEQRLCTPRLQKNSAAKASGRIPENTKVALILPVFLAVMFWYASRHTP